MGKLLIDSIKQHAIRQPNKCALTFLAHKKAPCSLTYLQLYQQSCALAHRLKQRYQAGDRVLLLLPPGLNYIIAFLACLQARLIAVPCYPAINQRFATVLSHIVADCDPSLILTDIKIHSFLKMINIRHKVENPLVSRLMDRLLPSLDINLGTQLPNINRLVMLNTKRISKKQRLPPCKPEEIAFLQYSSGTTGKPKGVMVSHGNIAANLNVIKTQLVNHDYDDKANSWLPPYHDMGLITGILFPLYIGFPVYLRSPFDFIKSPLQWLSDIAKYKATISGGPNFAYALCSKLADEMIPQDLDLSSWQVAFCGAEMIQQSIMQAFLDKFSPYGFPRDAFLPCYGLAETTVYATGKRGDLGVHTIHVDRKQLSLGKIVKVPHDAKERTTLFTSGGGYEAQKLVIVDPNSFKPLDDNHIGKIMLQSSSVTQGYWRKPELTKEIYQKTLDGYNGNFLDTGDLGALINGQLLIAGRIKDTIIIHGLNYNVNLIEVDIANLSPQLRLGSIALIHIESMGNEGIIALAEVKNPLDNKAYQNLGRKINQKIFDLHHLTIQQVYFFAKNTLIKTTSGKLSHQKCADAIKANQLTPNYHWQANENKAIRGGTHLTHLQDTYRKVSKKQRQTHLKKVVMRQLKQQGYRGRKIKKLSQAQLDSITLVAFLAGIEKQLHYFVRLPTSCFYQYDKLDAFITYVDELLNESLHHVMEKEQVIDSLPLLPLQVFYLNHIKVQKFHMGKILDLHHTISAEKLRQAIESVIAIQPYLHAKVLVKNKHFHLNNVAVSDSYHWQTDRLVGDDLVGECNSIAGKLCLTTNYWQGKLLAVSYIEQKNSNKTCALIVINHLAIDLLSFHLFLQQLDLALHNQLPALLSNVIQHEVRNIARALAHTTGNSSPPMLHIPQKKISNTDEASHLMALDNNISQALLNTGDNFDAILITAWAIAYKAVINKHLFDLVCIRDGHMVFDIKNLISFSCLYVQMPIDINALQQKKDAVAYIADTLQQKQRVMLKENSKASVDPNYIDFSLPKVEYNNMGAGNRFVGKYLAENPQFTHGFLSETFDEQFDRYREMFIRPVLIDNQVHLWSSFLSRLYSADVIKALNDRVQSNLRLLLIQKTKF